VILPVVPPLTGTAVPAAAPSTKNCTLPVGVPPVTAALTVIIPVDATFVADTVSWVVVAVGGVTPPPVLPPPQPSVKLSMHTRPRPSAAR